MIVKSACLYYFFVLMLPHVGATDILTPFEAMNGSLNKVSAGNKSEFNFFSPLMIFMIFLQGTHRIGIDKVEKI